MTRDELIRKLEAATEGSRKLDIALDAWLRPSCYERQPLEPGREEPPPGFGSDDLSMAMHAAPRYTTSLDSAVTLVPEGHAYNLTECVKRNAPSFTNKTCIATVDLFSQLNQQRPDAKEPWAVSGDAPTLALALCIAALRARPGEKP